MKTRNPLLLALFITAALLQTVSWNAHAGMATVHGSLKSSSYSAYANYLKTFANYFKNNGASLHAISLQNEPDWDPNYAGYTWKAAQFDMFINCG